MSTRENGSIVGPDNTPSLYVADGVWNLSDIQRFVSQNIWPEQPTTPELVATHVLSGSETVIEVPSGFDVLILEFDNVVSSTGGDLQIQVSGDGVTYLTSSVYAMWRDMTGAGTDLETTTTAYAFARVVPTSAPGYYGTGVIMCRYPYPNNGTFGHSYISYLANNSVKSVHIGRASNPFSGSVDVNYIKVQLSTGTYTGTIRVKGMRRRDSEIGLLLEEQDNVTSNVELTLPTTYDVFTLEIEGLLATGTADLQAICSDGTYRTGASDYGFMRFMAGGGTTITDTTTNAIPPHRVIATSGSGVTGYMTIYRVANGIVTTSSLSDGTVESLCVARALESAFTTGPINKIKFYPSAAAFSDGKFRLKGVKKASVESDLALTNSFSTGTLSSAPVDKTLDVVWASDITMPSSFSSDGLLFEFGGTGSGCGVGIVDSGATLRVLSGYGGANSGFEYVTPQADIPTTSFTAGETGTLVWEYRVNPGRVRVWWNDELVGFAETSGGAALYTSAWAGVNDGHYGGTSSSSVMVQLINSAFPGTVVSNLRYYENQLVT